MRQDPEKGEDTKKSKGFMDQYNFTLNPYSGCYYGCTYCYAAFFRANKEEQESWGEWVKVKENGITKLATSLKNNPTLVDQKTIYMSTVTDPYQPIEGKINLTRGILELLAEHQPKLVVQTRSPLVVRDCDLFHKIVEKGGRVQVNMTVTTDDDEIRKAFEPYAPRNDSRMKTIAAVQEKGIQSCITMTPTLLVRDREKFSQELIDTGVQRFIAQSFRISGGRFTAQTGPQAQARMAELMGHTIQDFQPHYEAAYRAFFQTMDQKLRAAGLQPLGEGKDGFAPPF